MDFTNALPDNEEDSQNEDFYYEEEESVENVNFLNIMFTNEMTFYQWRKKFHQWKSLTKKV